MFYFSLVVFYLVTSFFVFTFPFGSKHVLLLFYFFTFGPLAPEIYSFDLWVQMCFTFTVGPLAPELYAVLLGY